MIRIRTGAMFALALSGAMSSGVARADDGLDLKVFGDFEASARGYAHALPGDVHTSFGAHEIELFPTFESGRWSFLAEMLEDGNIQTNTYGYDTERVQLSYLAADWFRFRMGRFHTAFGYYNDSFHHGRFFEMATNRPFLVNFEDSGGLIISHMVGIGADGRIPIGIGDIRYDVDFGNGRAVDPTGVATAAAEKEAKAINVRLRFMPKGLDGFFVGFNALRDVAPACPATGGAAGCYGTDATGNPVNLRPNDLTEYDFGAHAGYVEGRYHFLAEGAYSLHHDETTKRDYKSYGAFIEAGVGFGDFMPYVRGEALKVDGNDPYWSGSALAGVGTLYEGRVGIKWLASANVALKVEGRWTATDQAATSPLTRAGQTAITQVAFGF